MVIIQNFPEIGTCRGGRMIVLIAGASHTGKTALAQKLLEKHKYPYLSIDHLKMCQLHQVDYILINNEYEVDIQL